MRARRVIAIAYACSVAGLLPGCAAHAPSHRTPAPMLFIREALADSAELCVPVVPHTSSPVTCITVGDLRRELRSFRLVSTELQP